jgi:hypothetical protein
VYQQSHSLVGVLDNDLSSEEDYEEVRDPPKNEGTVTRHRCNHEANRNRVGALDNDLSTEEEDDEEEIIDLSDEVMEEQGIQGTRGQALTGARDPLVGIRILTSQANADAGSGSGGSSDHEPMEDQGMFQHSTMLADGTVTEFGGELVWTGRDVDAEMFFGERSSASESKCAKSPTGELHAGRRFLPLAESASSMSSTETFPIKVEPTLTERSFLEGEAEDSVPAELSAARFIVDLVEPLPEAILE